MDTTTNPLDSLLQTEAHGGMERLTIWLVMEVTFLSIIFFSSIFGKNKEGLDNNRGGFFGIKGTAVLEVGAQLTSTLVSLLLGNICENKI